MFGPGGPNAGGKKDVNNKRYYELIGVESTATDAQIKKAYRKKCLKMHPDKGGDEAQFQDLTLAFKTLEDPQKRAAYDKFGEEGMKAGAGGAAGGPDDFFEQMFGGKGAKGPAKTKSVIHPVKCTLEDLYNGKSTRIKINRDILCTQCDASGGDKSDLKKCHKCYGKGKITKQVAIGPGQFKDQLM